MGTPPLNLSSIANDGDTNDDNHNTQGGLSAFVLSINGTLLITALVLGVTVNGALVTVIRRHRRLWTLTNGLLAWAAACKVVVLSTGVPLHLAAVAYYPNPLPATACEAQAILNSMGNVVGCGIVTSVAYLRYTTICKGNSCLLRQRRLLQWVSPSCVYGLLITSFEFLLMPSDILCLSRRSPTSNGPDVAVLVTEWLIRLFLTCQVALVTYSYTRIAIALCKHEKKRPSRNTKSSVTKHRSRMDIITTMSGACHVIVCLATYLPLVVFVPATYAFLDDTPWATFLSLVLSFNYLLLALADPVLYLIVCKTLRNELITVLVCLRHQDRKGTSSPPSDYIMKVKFINIPVQLQNTS